VQVEGILNGGQLQRRGVVILAAQGLRAGDSFADQRVKTESGNFIETAPGT